MDEARLIRLGLDALEASRHEPTGFGLSGFVGNALFACTIQRVDPSVDSVAWVGRAVEAFNEHGANPSLHEGFAGMGLVLATFLDADELLADVDEALVGHLARLPPASMQSGIAGVGLYASLRSQAATGRELQHAITASLKSAASVADGVPGLVWHTPASYARDRGVDVLAEPVLELGMVHGMGGTLVALAALAKQGLTEAADLARAGLRAAWSLERSGPNRFGRIDFGAHSEGKTREMEDPARWCVGDIGVLRALWLAAAAVDDPASATRALEALRGMATTAAAGPVAATGRLDLCCGAAATAQVYLRMHRDAGDAIFREANRRLLERCAEGVESLEVSDFRYGRMGVLLALLSAETNDELGWDGMLGMSLPARATRA